MIYAEGIYRGIEQKGIKPDQKYNVEVEKHRHAEKLLFMHKNYYIKSDKIIPEGGFSVHVHIEEPLQYAVVTFVYDTESDMKMDWKFTRLGIIPDYDAYWAEEWSEKLNEN